MMTKKLAIFVEGQTEQLLIEKLVNRAATTKNFLVKKTKLFGGKRKNNPRILTLEAVSSHNQYFVLIVDSAQDERVKSDIMDQYNSLVRAGYQKIIGVRDARPAAKNPTEVPRLRKGLNSQLPCGSVPILFVLSIMELEAWLMAEYFHFPRIHVDITHQRIKNELNIDLIHDDLSLRECPALDLKEIYWLEKIPYDKSLKTIMTILSNLDLAFFKNTVGSKFSDLQTLHKELDLFFLST